MAAPHRPDETERRYLDQIQFINQVLRSFSDALVANSKQLMRELRDSRNYTLEQVRELAEWARDSFETVARFYTDQIHELRRQLAEYQATTYPPEPPLERNDVDEARVLGHRRRE